ncbi:hypothetical protein TTHERM_00437300 (macronuclear) [Tetrahymena thermophila SB210]|uniref:Uncharacterized protein n=1 Tax=Tetrahymena thermophila (strain SB210) TaxID=312017 RepID=I7LV92_TETTS|nr:hypothetical protein TTHERM_00437300 [Tetrahymena thermophila SB210]EAR97481.1 hypothetical protein TTHERM_00437300 [Tetrahymena thermophila SB210]|eukprot:XP_001017726.1 hypothetical protein TTHERM_00437300 [Tetrahymena thermophila SB210]
MSSSFQNSQQVSQIQQFNLEKDIQDGFSIALFLQIAQQVAAENISENKSQSYSTQSARQEQSLSKPQLESMSQIKNNDMFQSSYETDNSSDIVVEIEEYQEDTERENDEKCYESDDNDDQEDSKYYFAIKKSNIMKNILKSFQRYIESEKNQERQKEFCRLANKSYSYSQLKKLINRNLKAYGKRWNMKAKHMIEKASFNMLLKYFLENINQIWLEKSKVQNKDEHLKVVQFMLDAIENPSSSQKLHFYQKKKTILK